MPEHRPPATRQTLLVRGVVWLALMVGTVMFFAPLVSARDAGAASPRIHPTTHSPPPTKAATVPDADAGGSPAPIGSATGGAASTLPVPTTPFDAGIVEAKTLDGGTRAFTFSAIDIEGRLKSPQLVYFLRRVRAEFGAEGLGHRSFLREMSETRKESSF